jgi:hypothetical protein
MTGAAKQTIGTMFLIKTRFVKIPKEKISKIEKRTIYNVSLLKKQDFNQ